jgi:hypothetical protein
MLVVRVLLHLNCMHPNKESLFTKKMDFNNTMNPLIENLSNSMSITR